MSKGSMVGCFEEWELWSYEGAEYHINVKTFEVMRAG